MIHHEATTKSADGVPAGKESHAQVTDAHE